MQNPIIKNMNRIRKMIELLVRSSCAYREMHKLTEGWETDRWTRQRDGDREMGDRQMDKTERCTGRGMVDRQMGDREV
jgi:hypothetical protein